MKNAQMVSGSAYLVLSLAVSSQFAQQGDRVDLGRLQNGATVAFVRAGEGEWGIEIAGGSAPRLVQQEGWRMGPGGPGRGVGGHRFWLPWISANRLYGITGLEEYDPALFRKLCPRQQ